MNVVRNPYLEEFNSLGAVLSYETEQDPIAYQRLREQVREVRKEMVRKYAWGIPSDQALATIARYAPIVEIGAGAGYWAWMLRQMGTQVAAYDLEPKPSFLNGYRSRREVPWTEVLSGSSEAVEKHPGHTLFLCWAPPDDSMDVESLCRCTGEHVIFVGTRQFDYTGSSEFYFRLKAGWDLIEEVEIPRWPEAEDRMFVYKRYHQ